MNEPKKKSAAAKKVANRAKGGVARATALTQEQRSLIAKKAALARHGLKATHRGNFKDDFGIDVECYVLNDEQKTAVISQTGMGVALGLSSRGNAFPRFIASRAMSNYLSADVLKKIENPIKFQWGSGGAEQPPSAVNGYDVSLLMEICNSILEADTDGALSKNQEHLATNARILLNASSKAGIKGLVYALAGYRPEVEEVISAFKAFVQNEAKKYEQEFPSELYMAWHRLYQIPIPVRGKPWQLMHMTRRHIYYPLAKSSGRILELLRALRDKDPGKKKLFQFLNEVGTRALRMHMGRVLEMAESSATSAEYEAKFAKRFGAQQELDLAED
nr:hypothetical protein 3.6 [Burkholderia phage Bups phi1]